MATGNLSLVEWFSPEGVQHSKIESPSYKTIYGIMDFVGAVKSIVKFSNSARRLHA
jgi:hypothetical protein